jgi:hypothetical protein
MRIFPQLFLKIHYFASLLFFRIEFSFYVILSPVPRSKYKHSAYYYAYRYGWTYSEARTFAGAYFDQHTYRPRMRKRPDGKWCSKEWFEWQNASKEIDSAFNPLLFAACVAVDLANAMRDKVGQLADPVERERMKRELMSEWRRVRRPFYYAQETERRRALAMSRRKIKRRSTLSKMPTPELILEAWNRRKDSKEAMIRLGGIMQDLECYVDNCLKIDETGKVVGRNGGIRGWLKENLPDLFPKYKTLMRYKAMAIKLRQATGTKDPVPTQRLLRKPYHKVVDEILSREKETFATVIDVLERHLSPQRVLDG